MSVLDVSVLDRLARSLIGVESSASWLAEVYRDARALRADAGPPSADDWPERTRQNRERLKRRWEQTDLATKSADLAAMGPDAFDGLESSSRWSDLLIELEAAYRGWCGAMREAV